MQVQLDYGRTGLKVELPADTNVISAKFVPGVPNETAAIQAALSAPIGTPPLAELVEPGDTVVITHTDITRATPNDRLLPVLIGELEAAGIHPEDITLLNALGTHRPQTEAELRAMLGNAIVDNYRCIQHNAFDDGSLVSLGETSLGHPVRVNRHFLDADFRILTGFIEPHIFAGFSGGPKGVLPAISGAESVHTNHGVKMIAHPKATWGSMAGNPIWEEMREAALLAAPDFLLNVTMNAHKAITGIFAGDMLAAHAAGCAFLKEAAMVPVAEPYDIVVTTNSGYPLDQNLYQSIKGMSSARNIVRQGGDIIIATACEEGIPDYGEYFNLLKKGRSPQGILDMISAPGFQCQDQWQVQLQALVQLHANVYVYTDGLSDAQIEAALFNPCHDIPGLAENLRAKHGTAARICVMPDGPQTIGYLHD